MTHLRKPLTLAVVLLSSGMHKPPRGYKLHPVYPLAANKRGAVVRWLKNANKWRLVASRPSPYYYQSVTVGCSKKYRHHVVYECFHGVQKYCCKTSDGLVMDHIDGNKDNNRLSNLRIITNAENSRAMTARYVAAGLLVGHAPKPAKHQ